MNKKYKFLVVPVLFLAGFFAAIQANGAGEVDPAFNAQAYRGDGAEVRKIIRQPDGKILVGGTFRVANGVEKCAVVRLNADYSVDNSFILPQFFLGIFPCNGVQSLAIQPDGKILVVGKFFGTSGNTFAGVRRLNADGSLDTTFTAYSSITPNSSFVNIEYVEVQPDGKILLSGDFNLVNNQGGGSYGVRLNADGTKDTSFQKIFAPTDRILKLQPDGKILIRSGGIKRINADGSDDNTFQTVLTNGSVKAVEFDFAGKIFLGGDFTTVNGFSTGAIVKLNADGSLDASFNLAVGVVNVNDIKFDANGKLVVVGNFNLSNAMRRIVRLNADGTLDNSFASPFTQNISPLTVLPLPDGKILIGFLGPTANPIYLLNSNGSFDTSFNVVLGSTGIVNRILQQPDGKILVGGTFRYVNGNRIRRGIARFNADGTVDNTFTQLVDQEVTEFALQPDGKILVVRNFPSTSLIRLNTDGSIDPTFTDAPAGTRIKVLPNGKFFLAGAFTGSATPVIKKFNADGTPDNTFNAVTVSQTGNAVFDFEIQPDGKIVIGGTFSQLSGVSRGNFARLNADGSLDTTFNPPFGANGDVMEIELQSTGKIILAGKFTGINGNTNSKAIARLNTDGSLDTSFTPPLIAVPPSTEPVNYAIPLKIQPDDKILVIDQVIFGPYSAGAKVIRLQPDGNLDGSFSAVTNRHVADIELQSDGKVLIGGDFTRVNNSFRTDIARLQNATARSRFDFDGDGRSDISVFRPSNGSWYIQQSTAGFTGLTFGLGTDLPVPADFDGDGKTDIAVFRPSNGGWYYLRSSDNAFVGVIFGQNGDLPRPADFDGDGKADINVFRPATGSWYRLNSTDNSFFGIAFGQNGDQPLIADFDGDGKSDITVFRPSTGSFYSLDSSNGAFRGTAFGFGTDIPTLGDFDGDGKTDVSVFRPSNGSWYRLNSTDNSFFGVAFGQNGDVPVAADYDGDGKTDIGVFRNGNWYYLNSSNGAFVGLLFGFGTDKPIPAAFQQ